MHTWRRISGFIHAFNFLINLLLFFFALTVYYLPIEVFTISYEAADVCFS